MSDESYDRRSGGVSSPDSLQYHRNTLRNTPYGIVFRGEKPMYLRQAQYELAYEFLLHNPLRHDVTYPPGGRRSFEIPANIATGVDFFKHMVLALGDDGGFSNTDRALHKEMVGLFAVWRDDWGSRMREERVHHDTWRTFSPAEQRNILNDMSLDEAAMQRMADSAQDLGESVVHEPMALHLIAGNMYRQMSYFESETGIPVADQMSEWAYDFQASDADNLSAFNRFIDSLPERPITDPSDFNTVKIYGKIFGDAHLLYRELDYLQDYDSSANEQKGLSLWILMMYLARDRFAAYIEGDWESVRRIFRDQLAVFAQFHWCWLIKWVWEKIRVEDLRRQRLVERLDLGTGVRFSIQSNYVDDYDESPVGPNGERF